MGIAQHHDAVSGTEKQHVADDYAQRLSDGIDSATVNISKFILSFVTHSFTFPYSLSSINHIKNFCQNKVHHQIYQLNFFVTFQI